MAFLASTDNDDKHVGVNNKKIKYEKEKKCSTVVSSVADGGLYMTIVRIHACV